MVWGWRALFKALIHCQALSYNKAGCLIMMSGGLCCHMCRQRLTEEQAWVKTAVARHATREWQTTAAMTKMQHW